MDFGVSASLSLALSPSLYSLVSPCSFSASLHGLLKCIFGVCALFILIELSVLSHVIPLTLHALLFRGFYK